jgi:hypothetical protein
LLAAARTGTYPLGWLAEVLLTAGWGERVALAPLLQEAVDRRVLRAVKGGYAFRGDLRGYLAQQGGAALAEHRRQISARLTAPWARRVVLPRLTRREIIRVSCDVIAGAGIATAIVGIAPPIPGTTGLERTLNEVSPEEPGEEPGEEPEEPAVHEP